MRLKHLQFHRIDHSFAIVFAKKTSCHSFSLVRFLIFIMASGSNDSQLPSVNIESADHTTLIVEPESSGPLSSLFVGNVAETVNVTGAVDSVMVARSGTPSTLVRKRAASVSPSRGRGSPPLPVSSGRSKRTLPVESPPAVVSPPKGSMADSGPAVESTTPLMTSVRGHWSHPAPDFARTGASNDMLSLSKRIEQLEALVQGLATSQVSELEDAMRKIISSFGTLNTQSQEEQLGATQMQERQHARDQVEMRTKLDELSSTVASSVQPPGLGTFQIHTPPGQPCKQAFPTSGPRNHRQLPRFTLRKRSLALDHRNHRWLSEFMNKQRFREQRQCLPS